MKEAGESTTKSTNYLGRALMTPDELRRLDVEKCIIIEKGIYPVMADKFMYFKEPEGKVLFNYKANNKEYRADRGFWQEFDPYRKKEKKKKKEIEKEFSEEEKDILGIFDDEKKKEKDDVMLLDIDDIIEEEPIKASGIPGAVPINIVEDDETFLERDRPKPDEYNLDIEKELENKFDQLFGSLE